MKLNRMLTWVLVLCLSMALLSGCGKKNHGLDFKNPTMITIGEAFADWCAGFVSGLQEASGL